MGFSSISPWSDSGSWRATFNIAAGIYLIVVAMLSSTIGGYVAGRLRTKWTGLHTEASAIYVLGSDWNLSSAPPLRERTNDIGGNYGSRSLVVVDRYTHP